jgi:hypothetical protein
LKRKGIDQEYIYAVGRHIGSDILEMYMFLHSCMVLSHMDQSRRRTVDRKLLLAVQGWKGKFYQNYRSKENLAVRHGTEKKQLYLFRKYFIYLMFKCMYIVPRNLK